MGGIEVDRIHIEDMGNVFTIILASFRIFNNSIKWMFDDLVCERFASNMVAALLEFV